jgi:cytochrome P450
MAIRALLHDPRVSSEDLPPAEHPATGNPIKDFFVSARFSGSRTCANRVPSVSVMRNLGWAARQAACMAQPVARQDDGTWVASGYAAIRALLHDPRVSSEDLPPAEHSSTSASVRRFMPRTRATVNCPITWRRRRPWSGLLHDPRVSSEDLPPAEHPATGNPIKDFFVNPIKDRATGCARRRV